jgi:soluble lytic murein transglycosylase-like protein
MLPLFVSDVPLHCVNEAAYEYHVPAKLIIAVLNTERGKIGQAVKNKNGTYDLGPMQINSSWWPKLYQYQVTPKQVLTDACTNIRVGAWILAKEIASGGSLLVGVGDYHSHTMRYNQPYVQTVRMKYTHLVNYLT